MTARLGSGYIDARVPQTSLKCVQVLSCRDHNCGFAQIQATADETDECID